ncbi:MAG: hypothetical protein NT001_01225 [Candidatus Woesearchaeota archaeon]|nr:hypothetical protein [Candidatus Woesearchaeota archaeon]
MEAAKTHLIEVVCTGNNGRSPMAEVIGNHTSNEMGLEGKLHFISSGTKAAPDHDNELPYEKASSILKMGSSHGLINPIEVDKQRYENDPDYNSAIKAKVQMALSIMRPIETALRNAALFDIGLRCYGERMQTKPRDDVSLVLGMEQKHVSDVEKIYYLGRDTKPQIATITGYAGIEGNIPDALGNTDPKIYKQARDKLIEAMPLVISRFREEHRL